MHFKALVIWLCISQYAISFGQDPYHIKGLIVDSMRMEPVVGAHITAENFTTISDHNGRFTIPAKSDKATVFRVTHVGYYPEVVSVPAGMVKKEWVVRMEESITSLIELKIQGKSIKRENRESALVSLSVTDKFLFNNRENSLMQTLNNIPGISSMNIGSGQSKPTIRGMGFNRVAVVEDGIKHEAQQWGADHGLEIDQYGIENIRIIKGPASLLYGSDAIAGIIEIKAPATPLPDTFEGDVNLLGETNNNLMGISAGIKARKHKWYYRGRLTYRDYADYKVPTDKISYENYIFELYDNNLRNTAGHEFNSKLDLGFVSDHVRSEFSISNVYGKNGFFANAHGLEVRTSSIDYDRNDRDIDLPFHVVNHFKVSHNTSISYGMHNAQIDWGFQNNKRQEHTEPTAHGYMPMPGDTEERLFYKNTYSFNARDAMSLNDRHTITPGVNVEFQDNTIGGWGFLIPAFHRFTTGLFLTDHFVLHPDLHIHGGLRYDFGVIHTRPYRDWFRTPRENADGTTSHIHLERSQNRRMNFGNISTSVGLSYIRHKTTYKINLGKGFRMPLASELSSDGVNYHMYRFEKGNTNLDAETSYQMDLEIEHNANKWHMGISPFINFFDNYIFLNPSPDYYETLQIFNYTQSKVLRAGGEVSVGVTLFNKLGIDASGEYVWSRQVSGAKKGFTLPFSPPLSTLFSATYEFEKFLFLNNPQVVVTYRETAKQDRIVPPEDPTKGYRVFHLAFTADVQGFWNSPPVQLRMKLNNIFNTRYFNHSSFYRLIDIPEPGRNVSLSITIPFTN